MRCCSGIPRENCHSEEISNLLLDFGRDVAGLHRCSRYLGFSTTTRKRGISLFLSSVLSTELKMEYGCSIDDESSANNKLVKASIILGCKYLEQNPNAKASEVVIAIVVTLGVGSLGTIFSILGHHSDLLRHVQGRLGTHEKQLNDFSRAFEEVLHTLGDIRASLKSHETILKQHTDAMTKAFEMIAKQEEKMAKHEEKMANHEVKMLEMGNDYLKAMDNLIKKIDKI